MQKELMTATNSLTKILTSTDIKTTVCDLNHKFITTLKLHEMILRLFFFISSYFVQLLDMVEKNEINRSLLTLLDENIANAYRGNQVSPG